MVTTEIHEEGAGSRAGGRRLQAPQAAAGTVRVGSGAEEEGPGGATAAPNRAVEVWPLALKEVGDVGEAGEAVEWAVLELV